MSLLSLAVPQKKTCSFVKQGPAAPKRAHWSKFDGFVYGAFQRTKIGKVWCGGGLTRMGERMIGEGGEWGMEAGGKESGGGDGR